MKFLPTLLIILALASAAACFQVHLSVPPTPPVTVPYVNVTRYLGVWYEQALIPFYFERGCIKTTATYSLNNNGSIRVDNKCERSGKIVESVGHAVPEDATNAKLKVEFIQTLDIGGQYWIVRLDKDYTHVVISNPTYTYLWILSRVPVMDQALYDSIIADLTKDGYPVDKLRRTIQE